MLLFLLVRLYHFKILNSPKCKALSHIDDFLIIHFSFLFQIPARDKLAAFLNKGQVLHSAFAEILSRMAFESLEKAFEVGCSCTYCF